VYYVFLDASSSSLRATLPGASSMRRGSFTSVVTLVNAFRFTPCFPGPSSASKICYQVSLVDLHPLWPDGVTMLLT
jgi:hypothetical protein